MTSLRRTALIWMTILLSIVGVAAFIASFEIARREAADFMDGQLRQIALNAGDGLPDAAGPATRHDPEDEFVIAIWNAAGDTLRAMPSGVALPRQSRPGFATVAADGEDWRVYVAMDGGRMVQVAQRMSVRREMAESAAIHAGAPVLVLIPLTWLVIGWALGQVLGRMSGLARKIAERGVDSKEPIPAAGVPAEVLPLVEAMNVLTNRLQHALEQQKRFVSDAAHELRTPLAALHLQIDNLRAGAADGQAPLIAELRGGVTRATALVEQLLRLARFEETARPTRRKKVDLSELVTQCVADFVSVASAKRIDLGVTARDKAFVSGWPADLKILFGNLIDNAIRYTPDGGSVDVTVQQIGAVVAVEVLDTGCGVAETDIPRLFDRFFRAAPIDVEGSGLGLSIAAAAAKRHGFFILVENRKGQRGLRVRVTNALI